MHSQDRQIKTAGDVSAHPPPVAAATVVTAVAGVVAAWVAAGSTGLLAHPLRRVVTVLLLATVMLMVRLSPSRRFRAILLLLLSAGIATYMVTVPLAAVNAMAAGIVLACLALLSTDQRRDVLLASATAVAVFGLYRFAVTSVPWLWLAADLAGRGLGALAGLLAGRPLRVGATFAGLDFLVLTGVLWALYVPSTRPPRRRRALYGALGILGGHLVFLVLLSYVPDLLAAIPQPEQGAAGASHTGQLLRQAVPWNLPVIACGIHVLIIVAMLRWSSWAEPRPQRGLFSIDALEYRDAHANSTGGNRAARKPAVSVAAAATVAAVLVPVVATLYPHHLELTDKKIVFYEKGFLNWLKPTHGSYGRLSSGMYGMLPAFVESLGAESLLSTDLSEADLEDADAVTLIFPDEPWQNGQLDRIHDYVRRGGSLLVLGEHTTRDENGSSRFNEALSRTAMQVQFDSATFAVGGWLQSYEALSHPMTVGISDERNDFGVVIGASLRAGWPARPILIGRWGWADLGDEASDRAMMGNGQYDAGEKLGDLILAAEQPLGKGRVIALGDTSGLTNAINVSCYEFTSRLFAYLTAGAARPHAAWRQILTLLAGALLVILLAWQPTPGRTIVAMLALVCSLLACTTADRTKAGLLPDGRRQTPNNLAYVDASHVELYSSESWRMDGIGGLVLTLMRNGYLPLTLHELTPERIERAGLLISVAPSRPFSSRQIEAVRTFVNGGGILIVTTGGEQAVRGQALLDAFGLDAAPTGPDAIEPEPMGHFKSPYLESEGKRAYVRFHAAWPVACTDPNARPIAYGRGNRPVIVLRRVGAGKVVLVGDTCFAMNKNLEYENGAPFEGLRENADFWRWLLTVLRDEPMWVPPALQSVEPGPTPEPTSGEAEP